MNHMPHEHGVGRSCGQDPVHAGDVSASVLERALGRVAALAGPDQLVPALDALADALAAGVQPFQLRFLAAGLADGMRKGGDRQ